MEKLAPIIEFLKGKKSYLLVLILFALNLATQNDNGSIDWFAMFNNPELATQQVELLLIATFRASIAKIGLS